VTQETGIGLIVSPTTFDLTNAAQEIEIEVQKNVQYSVAIDDAGSEWIKQGGTKALSTDKVTFKISANESYDNREGKITFKQLDGDLSATVTVRQSQTNGLFITKPEYDLSNESHQLTVEVKANVDYDVTSAVDWIKYTPASTKALSTTTFKLDVAANDTYDKREGKVAVKQKNGDLTGIITIRQDQSYGLFLSEESVSISKAAQSVSVTVKYNVDFNVVVPSDVMGTMITSYSHDGGQTKALESTTYKFEISENKGYEPREASITFKQKDGSLSGTFKITQDCTYGLSVSKSRVDLQSESGSFQVTVTANVPYEVSIKDAPWIQRAETKGVTTENVVFNYSANEGKDERSATIVFTSPEYNLSEEVKVTQYGEGSYKGDIYITSLDELNEWGNKDIYFIDGDVTIKAISGITSLSNLNKKWKVITGELYIDGSYLTSLQGLDSIESLGGFTLHHYSGESLTGLSSLVEIKGAVNFDGPCSSMKDFTGLDKLESVGGSIRISGEMNDFNALQSFTGLNALKKVGGDFILFGDYRSLASFQGLNSLKEVGGSFKLNRGTYTSYYGFDLIKDCQGLNSLERIGGGFSLSSSFDGMLSFSGLEKLEYIGGTFELNGGTSDYSAFNSLDSFDGLSALTHIGFLHLLGGANVFKKLDTLQGLETVTYLGGFYITCQYLESFDEMSNISNKELSRAIIIQCPVRSLNCFHSIEKITDDCHVTYCKFIKNIDGFSNLSSVNLMEIANCDRFNSIEFMTHVTHVGTLQIQNNASLYDFTPLYNALSTNSINYLTISGNGYNPTKEQILNGEGKP
jgi:hypothetical protein